MSCPGGAVLDGSDGSAGLDTRSAARPAIPSILAIPSETRSRREGCGHLPHSRSNRVAVGLGEELVHREHDQFAQVILLPQGEFRRLLLAEVGEREALLARLFDSSFFKELEQQLHEHRQTIEREAQAKLEKSDTLAEQLSSFKAEYSRMQGEIARMHSEVQLLKAEQMRQRHRPEGSDFGDVKESFDRLSRRIAIEREKLNMNSDRVQSDAGTKSVDEILNAIKD